MAKVPKIKKKAVSVKSRAARRQASPSIDLDKSLKDIKPPSDGPDSGFIVPQNQAQQAPKSTKKPMKRQQRLRHEKGLERANAIADRTENKVTKSKKKSKVIKARAATWEDLNEAIGAQPKSVKKQKIPTKTAREILEMDMDLDEDEGDNIVEDDEREESPDPRAALVFSNGTTAADKQDLDEIT